MQHIKEINNNFFTIKRKIIIPKKINLDFFNIERDLGIKLDQNSFEQFFILAISQLSLHMQKAFSEIIEIKFHEYNTNFCNIDNLNSDISKNYFPKNGFIDFNKKNIKEAINIPAFYNITGNITISSNACTLIYEKNNEIVKGIYFKDIKKDELISIQIDYDFLNDANLNIMLKQHLFILIQNYGKINQHDMLNLYPKAEKLI
ncbi:MAG: hypothetical protein U1E31_02745 [Rickettsiales bacterium]